MKTQRIPSADRPRDFDPNKGDRRVIGAVKIHLIAHERFVKRGVRQLFFSEPDETIVAFSRHFWDKPRGQCFVVMDDPAGESYFFVDDEGDVAVFDDFEAGNWRWVTVNGEPSRDGCYWVGSLDLGLGWATEDPIHEDVPSADPTARSVCYEGPGALRREPEVIIHHTAEAFRKHAETVQVAWENHIPWATETEINGQLLEHRAVRTGDSVTITATNVPNQVIALAIGVTLEEFERLQADLKKPDPWQDGDVVVREKDGRVVVTWFRHENRWIASDPERLAPKVHDDTVDYLVDNTDFHPSGHTYRAVKRGGVLL